MLCEATSGHFRLNQVRSIKVMLGHVRTSYIMFSLIHVMSGYDNLGQVRSICASLVQVRAG